MVGSRPAKYLPVQDKFRRDRGIWFKQDGLNDQLVSSHHRHLFRVIRIEEQADIWDHIIESFL